MPKQLTVPDDLIKEATIRARDQEEIYGHNTGHFSLPVEKENTIIGVLGELLVANYIRENLIPAKQQSTVELCPLGSEFDLMVTTFSRVRYIHVKSGLWKQWPQPNWHFGIHADQGIETSGAPLVLVTFLKTVRQFPSVARIEGFITNDQLLSKPIIRKGMKFPSTGVLSRTDNILTKFQNYLDIEELIEAI